MIEILIKKLSIGKKKHLKQKEKKKRVMTSRYQTPASLDNYKFKGKE